MGLECAWCNNELKYNTCSDQRISNGLCCDCVNSNDFSMGLSLTTYIESQLLPIFIVNEGLILLYANSAALNFLNKKTSEVVGHIAGDVFGCIYTRLPYSCGLTHRCNVCTLMTALRETYHLKKMRVNAPVAITTQDNNDFVDINMMISTEKAGDVILLQIDMVFPSLNENMIDRNTAHEDSSKASMSQ